MKIGGGFRAVIDLDKRYTPDKLLYLSQGEQIYYLIDGRLLPVPKSGIIRGELGDWFVYFLMGYIDSHGLGDALDANTGFIIFPDWNTVIAADFAFVSAGRHPHHAAETDTYPQLAPDLVIDIILPNDQSMAIDQKLALWLEAGVRQAWVAYPLLRQIHIHSAPNQITILGVGDVLPGFSLPISELFSFLDDGP